jgi:hypothetical protein
MSTITTINASDQITNSRAVINTNFSNLNTDKIETSTLDTDTTLAANSDSKIATQKAVKAYVDAGGNVNASTTNKGIVEEATDAEIRALTAAGGTSARLFMNPSTAGPVFGIKSVTAGATITGATLPVPVYQNKTDNEFYACDANDTDKLKFLGFAISNGVDGGAMTVQFNGIVSGFTGLTEGEKYYLSDTVGTIANTIGTYEVLVGVAISETELLIQKGKRQASGNTGALGTATGSSAVTCGFRPTKISLMARTVTQGSPSILSFLDAVWCNGVIKAVAVNGGATTEGLVNSNAILYDGSGPTNYMTFSITSVTDTGFTVTWTETGTFDVNQSECLWVAEGEL